MHTHFCVQKPDVNLGCCFRSNLHVCCCCVCFETWYTDQDGLELRDTPASEHVLLLACSKEDISLAEAHWLNQIGFFIWALRIEFRSSGFQGKHFTKYTIFPNSENLFWCVCVPNITGNFTAYSQVSSDVKELTKASSAV